MLSKKIKHTSAWFKDQNDLPSSEYNISYQLWTYFNSSVTKKPSSIYEIAEFGINGSTFILSSISDAVMPLKNVLCANVQISFSKHF